MSDFETAKAILTANALSVCKRYLPKGQIKGEWWLASTPWRVDKNPSLVVNLRNGRWMDLALREDHGDLIDLIHKITGREAIEIVKEALGK